MSLKHAILRQKMHQELGLGKEPFPRLGTFPPSHFSKLPPDDILDELEEKIAAANENGSGWGLACASVGVSSNDAIPAVILVHPQARKVWTTLVSLFDGSDRRVEIQYLVEEGKLQRFISESDELQSYQEKPLNGASIGNQAATYLSGSLGGYLKISGEDDRTLGITCAHVLVGDSLSGHYNHTTCVQQSNLHYKHQEKEPDHDISPCEDTHERHQTATNTTELNAIQVPPKGRYFGSIGKAKNELLLRMDIGPVQREGLGLGEAYWQSIDWALIEVCKERVPVPGVCANVICGYAVTGWKKIDMEKSEGNLIVGRGQRVYMQGAQTGKSQGTLAEKLTRGVIFPGNERATREFAVLGSGRDFAAAGDSGSWVVEEDGNVIGMVFGGFRTTVAHITVLLSMESILEDIRKHRELKVYPLS
jgi:hypothetical protein